MLSEAVEGIVQLLKKFVIFVAFLSLCSGCDRFLFCFNSRLVVAFVYLLTSDCFVDDFHNFCDVAQHSLGGGGGGGGGGAGAAGVGDCTDRPLLAFTQSVVKPILSCHEISVNGCLVRLLFGSS